MCTAYCSKRITFDKVIVKILKVPMDPSSRTRAWPPSVLILRGLWHVPYAFCCHQIVRCLSHSRCSRGRGCREAIALFPRNRLSVNCRKIFLSKNLLKLWYRGAKLEFAVLITSSVFFCRKFTSIVSLRKLQLPVPPRHTLYARQRTSYSIILSVVHLSVTTRYRLKR